MTIIGQSAWRLLYSSFPPSHNSTIWSTSNVGGNNILHIWQWYFDLYAISILWEVEYARFWTRFIHCFTYSFIPNAMIIYRDGQHRIRPKCHRRRGKWFRVRVWPRVFTQQWVHRPRRCLLCFSFYRWLRVLRKCSQASTAFWSVWWSHTWLS